MIEIVVEARVQVLAAMGSLSFLFFIVYLIRRRKLKEEYSLLWLGACVFFFVLSFNVGIIEWIAFVAGIHYAPTAILLLLILGVLVILIHYSMVISRLSEQNKILVQELALFKQQLEDKG